MNRDQGLAILASQGWLAGTSEEFRGLFLPMARWRRFDAGTPVTLGGDEADDIIGMASGVMAFTSTLALADSPVSHIARAVFWMGYGPILLGGPRVVSAEARSEVWVASFPKARVLPLLDGSTRWWRYFMRLVGEYGHISSMIAGDLLIPESERRLAAVLLRLGGFRVLTHSSADALSARLPVLVPVTQAELAAAANLSRNSVGQILQRFAKRGVIETGYRGILITKPAGLLSVLEPSDAS
jgi:CRP/FNR family cyclic AMP-dependent transcriptional regulator